MTCKECHHQPSGRFNADGMHCFCGCHDVADAAPELLAAVESLLAVYAPIYRPAEITDAFSGAVVAARAAIAKARGAV